VRIDDRIAPTVHVVLAQNCVLTIVGATITSVTLCTGDAGGANGDAVSLTNQQITVAADLAHTISLVAKDRPMPRKAWGCIVEFVTRL
jgi:hypothetical protein